jgi:hypothetical protein
MGQIYLLHFDKPYKYAKHYLGYVDGDTKDDIYKRIDHHKNGSGARLMKIIKEAGIGFEIARTWQNVDRNYEIRIKNNGSSTRQCPICKKLKK